MPATQLSMNCRHAAKICTEHTVLSKMWEDTLRTLFSGVLFESMCSQTK